MNKNRCLALLLAAALLLGMAALPAAAQEAPTPLSLLTMSGNRTWLADNTAIKHIQEVNNIVLEVEMAQDVTTQLNLYVASGDVPDIVRSTNMTFINYLDTGYFLELSALIDQYAPDLRSILSQEAWDMTDVGGKTYVIPYENYSSKYCVFMRQDWLDTLGITLSNAVTFGPWGESLTLDEYADILRAFAAQDPDGNGKADTYGLSAGAASSWKVDFMHIFSAFGGQPDQSYETDQGVVPFVVSDSFREALSYLAGLWAEGVMDPEIFILNGDQAKQKMVQGVSGTCCAWWSSAYGYMEQGAADINPNVNWQPVYVTANDGQSMAMKDNGLITGAVLISADCKAPDVAMKFLNYLGSPDGWMVAKYGLEGEHYTLDSEGYVVRTELGTEMFKAGTLEPLSQIVQNMAVTSFQDSTPLSSTDPVQVVRYRFNRGVHDYKLITDLFYGLPVTDAHTEYGGDVDAYVTQMVIEFVTGATPINDETWAAYRASYGARGGSSILQSYVDEYNRLNNTALTAGSF